MNYNTANRLMYTCFTGALAGGISSLGALDLYIENENTKDYALFGSSIILLLSFVAGVFGMYFRTIRENKLYEERMRQDNNQLTKRVHRKKKDLENKLG